jgi:hypothetical protein
MLHFLKNKVLEVNNGIGYVPGGSFGVGQPFLREWSRFANWIFLWVQNGWDFSKPSRS